MAADYIQLKDNDENKCATMCIDGRPKTTGNIVEFINSTQYIATNKQPNCIFDGREGNHAFVCSIKSIVTGEELMVTI